MTDVFVSYNRDDRPVARRFAESFEREGFSVWWDQALNPGEAFDQVTEQALEAARAVVVLWSKASVNSRWVRAEATHANANGRLVPVMVEHCRRPIIFELTHTVDLSDWDGDPEDPRWQSLVASVRRVVQRGSTEESPLPTAMPAPRVEKPTAAPAEVRVQAPVDRSADAAGDTPESPRRRALLYGASALGLTAAGFTAGALLGPRRSPETKVTASASVATFQRLTFRRGLIRSARIAPDGQTILHGALWDGEMCRVYSTRIDNPESRALDLPNANLLAVSRSGDLAIALGPNLDGLFTLGTLARVPIAGGAPRELVERVKFADWSPDGAEIAIVRSVENVDRLEYPLGTVRVQPAANEGTGLGFVRISPDGQAVAFVHYTSPQSLRGKVCLLDRSGKVVALTDQFTNIHGLAWRGTEIWFSASNDLLFRSIMAVSPGSAPRVLSRVPANVTLWDAAADGRLLIAQTDDRAALIAQVDGDAQDRDLSWLDSSQLADLSADGRQALFSESGQGVGAVPAAYLRGTDGSPAVRLGSGWALALSPDARAALLLAPRQSTADSQDILELVPTGAGETRRLPDWGLRFSNARWLPDASAIVLKAAEPGRPPRLHHLTLPEGEPVAVTPEGIRDWVISPDGSTIAASGPEADIRLHPLARGPAVPIPQTSGEEWLLAWIHDGLLIMRVDDPTFTRGDVYLLDPTSGRQRPWANVLPRDSAGIMHMISFAATRDGRTRAFTWHRALSNLYLAVGLE